MHKIFLLFAILTPYFTCSQIKEVIKIDVQKGCGSYISKRTYINEIYTKPIKIVDGVYIEGHIGFAYKEHHKFDPNGTMIYIHLDEDFDKYYESSTIRLTIDSINYELNNPIDRNTRSTLNFWMESVKTYSLGYAMKEDLMNAIANAENISISLLKTTTHVRKTWELKKSLLKEVKESMLCFKEHYEPIESEFKRVKEEKAEIDRQEKELEKKREEEARKIKEEEAKRKRIEAENKIREANIIRLKADSISEIKFRSNLREYHANHDTILSIVEKTKKNGRDKGGILVNDFEVQSNDYDVTDIRLGVFNCSNKRIKYVEFSVRAYNAVDDPIGVIEKLKGVGYVEPDQSSSWVFNNVWYSGALDYVKILSIKLTYEDGVQKTITDIGKIRIDNSEILNSFIDFADYDPIYFGSISFDVYKGKNKGFYALSYSSINHNGEVESEVFSWLDLQVYISELETAIELAQVGKNSKSGFFNAYDYTTNIYVYKDYYSTLISLDNAKALLAKMKDYAKNE